MDKKLFRSLLLLITFTVLLILVIVKFDVLWGAVASVLTVCRPLFIGLAIAFVLTKPCAFFRCHLDRLLAGTALKKAMEQSAECEEKLTALLEDKEKALLLRLINAENEIGSTMALENFILGFRLGVRMILEALDEDDGSLIDPNKEG